MLQQKAHVKNSTPSDVKTFTQRFSKVKRAITFLEQQSITIHKVTMGLNSSRVFVDRRPEGLSGLARFNKRTTDPTYQGIWNGVIICWLENPVRQVTR